LIIEIQTSPIRPTEALSKRPHPPEKQQNLKQKRKRIETCFSGILKLFPRSIHAVTLAGFSLQITLFVGAYIAFMN